MHLSFNDPNFPRSFRTQRFQSAHPRIRDRRTDIQFNVQRQGGDENFRLHDAADVQSQQDTLRSHVQAFSAGVHSIKYNNAVKSRNFENIHRTKLLNHRLPSRSLTTHNRQYSP